MNVIKICSVIVFAFILSGCATNASVGNMVYSGRQYVEPKDTSIMNSVSVGDVAGGEETNPLWVSKINNDNFKDALKRSLADSRLLANYPESKYLLTANLLKLEQPFLGFNLTVNCQVQYRLKNNITSKIVYDKTIDSQYTATLSDSPLAVTRMKLANEGAAKENIKRLVEDLYRVKLNK